MKSRKLMCAVLLSTALSSCQTAPGTAPSKYKSTTTQEDGLYIRMYDGGNAVVSTSTDILVDGWEIDCRIDQMTDKRRCSVHDENNGGVFVFYGFKASPQSVCISGHDFPGRRGQIRVDTHSPVTTDREGCVPASRILPKLKGGNEVLTRRYRWPYDYPVDTRSSLIGFNKALEVVERIRSD